MAQLLELLAGQQCAAAPGAEPQGRGPNEPLPKPIQDWPLVCAAFKNVIGDGLPPIGSGQWCNDVEGLAGVFRAISATLRDFLTKQFSLRSGVNRLRLDNVRPDRLGINTAIAAVWNGLVDAVASLDDVTSGVIFGSSLGLYDLTRCLLGKYDADAVIGVSLMRTLISTLRNVRVGFDPGAWFTSDVEFVMDTLDHVLSILQTYYAPIEPPTAEEATEAWLLDRITEERRNCIWRLHGRDPEVYERYALVSREQLEWREAIQYARRRPELKLSEDAILRARGWIDEADRDAAHEMYWELPGVSDHLHWTQRNVFDAVYVDTYQLLDGFDDKFWPAFGDDLQALGMRKKYAQYHYAAHWIMPSPEQMARFVYRSDEIQAATGKPFTPDDYERLLTEQDYNKLARGWFKATIYQVPAISYIKEWYRQGVINTDELRGYHRQLGFSPKDAERFADIDELQRIRMRTAQTHGWTTQAASNAYANGQIDEAMHTNIYHILGYTKEEADNARAVAVAKLQGQVVTRARSRVLSQVVTTVRNALSTGIMGPAQATAALASAGWPAPIAAGLAQLESAATRTKVVQSAVTYVRRHVLDGSLTPADATTELQRLGIVPEAVQRYIQVWSLQLTPGRKRRTASQIVNDYATHQITRGQAIARLRNLQYSDADTRLYLADATAKMHKAQVAAQKASESAGLKRNRELLKVAREMDAQRKAVVKAMIKDQPVSKLDKWLKEGLIGKRYYTERLRQYDYSPNSITARIADVCSGKGAACVDTAGSVETTAPTSGGTGVGQGTG